MTLKVTKSKKKILFFFKVSLTGDWWDRICLPAPRDRTHTLLVQGQLVTHRSGYFIKIYYFISYSDIIIAWFGLQIVLCIQLNIYLEVQGVLQKCP